MNAADVIANRLPEHVVSRIQVADSGCWEWTGAKSEGYGMLTIDARYGQRIHRVAYERLVGPIPAGLTIDHLCGNKACCNPTHLEPVSNSENVRRANALRYSGFCPRGHEYTPENTYRRPSDRARVCRACARLRDAARRRARRDLPATSPTPATDQTEQ